MFAILEHKLKTGKLSMDETHSETLTRQMQEIRSTLQADEGG